MYEPITAPAMMVTVLTMVPSICLFVSATKVHKIIKTGTFLQGNAHHAPCAALSVSSQSASLCSGSSSIIEKMEVVSSFSNGRVSSFSNGLFLLSLEITFDPLHSLGSKNGEPTVLECLGKPEKDDPQDAFGGCADGKCHLGKRDDIAWNTEGKHDDTRLERQEAEPMFDALKKVFHIVVVCCWSAKVRILRVLWAS